MSPTSNVPEINAPESEVESRSHVKSVNFEAMMGFSANLSSIFDFGYLLLSQKIFSA